jgi:phage-related minor tail protein
VQTEQQKLWESTRTFESGWRTSFQNYVDDATNAAKQAERIFKVATSGMEDAIMNFAKTGKFEFKGFINSILQELLRSKVQQLIASTFGSFGGGGGARSITGRLLGFANGGIIPTNSPVLVGERGPELLVGASGNRVIPNDQLGGGTTVVYNINAVDALSFKDLIASDPTFIHAVAEQGRRSLPQTRR